MTRASSKLKTLSEVIDQIERIRNELHGVQTLLEKMEMAKPSGSSGGRTGSKTIERELRDAGD